MMNRLIMGSCIFLLLQFQTVFGQVSIDTQGLNPKIQALLILPEFDDQWLDNNIYPEMLAFFSPRKNIAEIGKQVMRVNYDVLRDRLNSTKKIEYNERRSALLYNNQKRLEDPLMEYEPSWTFPIKSFEKEGVKSRELLRDIKYEKNTLAEYSNEYKDVFDRYKNLSTQKKYKVTPYYFSTVHDFFYEDGLFSAMAVRFSHACLTQAVYLISEGKITEGLDIFERELDFLTMLARGENNHILDSAGLLLPIETIYSTMEDLIRSGIVTGDDLSHPFFTKIQEPLLVDDALLIHLDELVQRDLERKIRSLYIILFKEDRAGYTFEFPWGVYEYEKLDKVATLNLMYQYYQMGYENLLQKRYIASPSLAFSQALAEWQKNMGDPIEVGSKKYFVEDLYQIDDAMDFYKTVINRQKLLLMVLMSEQRSIYGDELRQEIRKNPFLVMDLIAQKPMMINSGINNITFIRWFGTTLNLGWFGQDYDSYSGMFKATMKLDPEDKNKVEVEEEEWSWQ